MAACSMLVSLAWPGFDLQAVALLVAWWHELRGRHACSTASLGTGEMHAKPSIP